MNAPIPDVVAHRGYALRYPENTLLAVREAIASGVRYVEVDVLLSRDGEPVLFHDEDVARMCGKPGLLQALSLAEIDMLRASEPEKFGDRYRKECIPTLNEFCECIADAPHITAFIEIKPQAVALHGADTCLTVIESPLAMIPGQSVLISIDVDFLAHLRRYRPDIPIGVVLEHWQQLESPAITALDAEYVFCDMDRLPGNGELQTPNAAKLVVYEIVDAALARELASRGVTLVESFACAELLQALGNTGPGDN